MGTDQLGRDVLSRALHGARHSLATGFMIKNSAVDVLVEANYIHDFAGRAAITIGGGSIPSAPGRYEAENVVVKNNLICNVKGFWYVVLFQSSYQGDFINNTVTDCSLSNAGRTLIEFYTSNNTPNVRPVITNNVFYNNSLPNYRLIAEDPWHGGGTKEATIDYNIVPTATTDMADTNPARCAGTRAPRKIVASRICVGHRPLQRAKLFVRIAISRSRGLSMIRVAITPAALHPKPIIMLSDCFPWAPALRNRLSRLNTSAA